MKPVISEAEELPRHQSLIKFSDICKEINIENIYDEIQKIGSIQKDYKHISSLITLELVPSDLSFSEALRVIADDIDKAYKK